MNSISSFIQQNSALVLFLFAACMALVALCLAIGNKRRQEREARYRCFIEHNSPRYLALLELNKQFDFSLNIANSYTYYIHAKSKAQFDNYNFDRYIEEKIEAELDACLQYIQILTAYQQKYAEYKDALLELPSPVSEEDIVGNEIPYEFYKNAETELVSKVTQPFINHQLICQCTYISPKGRTFLQRQQIYYLDDVRRHYNLVLYHIKEKSSKEYQRKSMTNSMRYDVMKRDNFRCVLCGRSSADGAVLHVDHIVPVAKGGKSVPENLRTLCQECNSGKRDKYDPDGIN